jgi:hypothetical protein
MAWIGRGVQSKKNLRLNFDSVCGKFHILEPERSNKNLFLLKRIDAWRTAEFEVPDIYAKACADTGANWNKMHSLVGKYGDADAANKKCRARYTKKSLVYGINGGQIIDQHHGSVAICPIVPA